MAAVLLCGLVVFLFLNNGRGTLISMTTIPVSMAMAILLMVPFGFSLNSSTLIGLLISIGRLVDDSVIDIHAVERHLKMGKDPKKATIDGITEVRLAVAASTLMLVLALTPLLFCGGITQLMFVGLVYPIIFGLLASFLVSLTLTAVLSARLLKPHVRRQARDSAESRPSWAGSTVACLAPSRCGLERMDASLSDASSSPCFCQNKFTVLCAALCDHHHRLRVLPFSSAVRDDAACRCRAGAMASSKCAPGASYAETERGDDRIFGAHSFCKHPEIKKRLHRDRFGRGWRHLLHGLRDG